MLVYDKGKVLGEVKLVYQQFTQCVGIDYPMPMDVSVNPMTYSDIQCAIGAHEDTSARYLRVVGLGIEDRVGIALCHSAVVLLHPIVLVEFVDGADTLVNIPVRVVLLHTEQGVVGIVVPENAHLRATGVCKAAHEVYHIAVFLAVGMAKHDVYLLSCYSKGAVYYILCA